MLSKVTENLPSRKDFLYEIKLDGQRTIAEVNKKSVMLYTRNFQNVTEKYPELQELSKCIKKKSAILDGEIVALQEGIPSFELLQQRMSLRDARAVRLAVENVPILYYVFDILEYDGISLLNRPLVERKTLLNKIVKPSELVKILPYFDSRDFVLHKAQEFGYEGVIAKKRDSHYYPGQRTSLWLKLKFQLSDSFVIGGWIEGGRTHKFGSLMIGKYDGNQLVYCGRAGTGFDEGMIRVLMAKFDRLKAAKSPFVRVPRTTEQVHFLKPKLVADVKFKEWTRAQIVRAPVFLGLREDLSPRDCRINGG